MCNCENIREHFDFENQKNILQKDVIKEKEKQKDVPKDDEDVYKRSSYKDDKDKKQIIKKGRSYNTILASSKKFKDDFKKLLIDRTSGKILSDATIVIPNKFDGREIWKEYTFPPRDQGLCGGSWAFTVASVLSERLAIYTNKKYKYEFSPTEMILCDMGGEDEYILSRENAARGNPYDYNMPNERIKVREEEREGAQKYGCNGETLIGAWQFAYRFGLVTVKCTGSDKIITNYSGGVIKESSCADLLSDTYDTCPNDNSPVISHLCEGYYYVPGTPKEKNPLSVKGTELDIRRDVYRWGPTSTAFKVYADLVNWNKPDEVYIWDGKSKYLGGQAVSIVGWGETDNYKYWIVKNSFGPKWNGDGHFKILRGKNHCEIEENVFVGFPNLYGIRLYVEWPLLTKTEDLALRAIWGIADSGYKKTTCENIVTGKIIYNTSVFEEHSIDEDLYLKEYWPDVSILVAGEPEKIVFRLTQEDKSVKKTAKYLKQYEDQGVVSNFLSDKSTTVIILYFILFAFLLFVVLKSIHFGLYFLKIIKTKPNIF